MKQKLITVILSSLLLSACATSQEELLPSSDQTMLDLWNRNSGQATLSQSRHAVSRNTDPPKGVSFRENAGYTRTAENEVQNLFPRLPNPDLVMYIFPHLSDSAEQIPVPGYSTVIPFYGRTQYAQPGERTRPY